MSNSETIFDELRSSEDEREEHSQVIQCQTKTRSKNQRKKYSSQQLKQMNYKVQSIYEINQYLDGGIVLIKGDIMVPFKKDDEFSRLSKFNNFKRITHINFDQEIATLEMAFEQMKYGTDDFDHIINIFSQQPNTDQRNFALQLQTHKNRVNELKNIQTMLKTYKQIDMVRNLIEESFHQFIQKMHDKIKSMYKSGEITIFKYNFYKVDYERADYLMTHCCCSELLLAIIGLDIDQFQQFCMRKGIIELMYHYDLFGISNIYLKLKNNSLQFDKQTDIILKTFDGIDIYAKVKFLFFSNDDPLLSNIFNTKEQHFAVIQVYEISQNQIDFLLAYRRTFKQKFDLRSFDNEQDWDYTAKAQSFIDKFYQK